MPQKLKPPLLIPDLFLMWLFTHEMTERRCTHLNQIEVEGSDLQVCPGCVEAGDDWPSLRMCLVCGYVGCCDQSKNKHMKKHVDETGHQIVRSIDAGEAWIWCYADDAFIRRRSHQLGGRRLPRRWYW